MRETSLLSAAYRALHDQRGFALRGLQVEILRELELHEITREQQRTAAGGLRFSALRGTLGVSAARVSQVLGELERAGLVTVVGQRGVQRRRFRITPAGTAAIHSHHEQVLAFIGEHGDQHQRRALHWLLQHVR